MSLWANAVIVLGIFCGQDKFPPDIWSLFLEILDFELLAVMILMNKLHLA